MKWQLIKTFIFVCVSCSHISGVKESFDPDAAFLAFNKNYKSEYQQLRKKLEELKVTLFTAQKSGRDITCSRQISEEASASLNNSADFSFAKRRILDLEKSLSDSRSQSFARSQSTQDGSWGQCYEQWSWKIVESVTQVQELDHAGKLPQYPMRLFDRINDPEKLRGYITSVLFSQPDIDGINRRRELNEVVTTLIRVIRKGLPKNYPWHPKLWQSFEEFMDSTWQNQETGF